MHSVARQGIKENGERRHQGFTLTCCHLGYLALMKHNATENLHVIMYHLPLLVIASRCPMIVVDSLIAINGDEVFGGISSQLAVEICCRDNGFLIFRKTTCGVLDNTKGHRHHFIKCLLIAIK